MNKAYLVKEDIEGFCGNAALYRLDPPVEYSKLVEKGDEFENVVKSTKWVVASTVIAMWDGLETLVFPSDSKGKVLSWGELAGERGSNDHAAVLAEFGYELQEVGS